MGNEVGRAITGIGKDTRKATPTNLPASTQALSQEMSDAIVKAINQDISFAAENQQAFREDRPLSQQYTSEDRALRDALIQRENTTTDQMLQLALETFGVDRANLAQDRATREGVIQGTAEGLDTSGSVLNTLISQIDEALKTGGVGAQIPIIARATEASRGATSNALGQLDAQLAASGLGRSSYGMRTRADTLLKGEQATADIGPKIAQSFIDKGATVLPSVVSDFLRSLVSLSSGATVPASPATPSTALINPQQVAGFNLANPTQPTPYLGLGPTGASLVASGTQQGVAGAQVAAQRDIAEWQAITQIYSSAIQAAGSAGGGCWVAFAIYGPGCKWALARFYIFSVWQGRTADIVRVAYRAIGPRLARSRRLCRMLKPLFDLAVKRGERAWAC